MRLWLCVCFTCTLLLSASPNALIHSHSPYLKSHAYNPVRWMMWGEEAFTKAKNEQKLIFLSIGYSTCHWCHVMEEESFEDEAIAALLNKDFISIKVDREEMPHIDTHYQQMLSMILNRRKGWPLTVILTPTREILYIATYVPPVDNYGVDGMHKLLPRLATLWKEDREQVAHLVATNLSLVQKAEIIPMQDSEPLIERFKKQMLSRFDTIYGGFDKNPKFPLFTHLKVLLDMYGISKDSELLTLVQKSVDKMLDGGIYDHIEGGLFRYSVYADWAIPHFEKMLYTQAEMISLLVRLDQISPKARYKEVIYETIYELNQRFRTPEGLYFSASDADSNGEEGRYFVYGYQEALETLMTHGINLEEAQKILAYLDITEEGNFELELNQPLIIDSNMPSPPRLTKAKEILKKMRQKRHYPFIDKKILVSWNAMMLKALFDASGLDKQYERMALTSLDSLLLVSFKNDTLMHGGLYENTWTHEGLLEDYAYMLQLLQHAYMHTFEKKYLEQAGELLNQARQKFYQEGVWYLDDTDFKAKAIYEDRYYASALGGVFSWCLDTSGTHL